MSDDSDSGSVATSALIALQAAFAATEIMNLIAQSDTGKDAYAFKLRVKPRAALIYLVSHPFSPNGFTALPHPRGWTW